MSGSSAFPSQGQRFSWLMPPHPDTPRIFDVLLRAKLMFSMTSETVPEISGPQGLAKTSGPFLCLPEDNSQSPHTLPEIIVARCGEAQAEKRGRGVVKAEVASWDQNNLVGLELRHQGLCVLNPWNLHPYEHPSVWNNPLCEALELLLCLGKN